MSIDSRRIGGGAGGYRSLVAQSSLKFFGCSLGGRSWACAASSYLLRWSGNPVGCDATDIGSTSEWINWNAFSLSYPVVFILATLRLRDVWSVGPVFPGRSPVSYKAELQSFVGFHNPILPPTPLLRPFTDAASRSSPNLIQLFWGVKHIQSIRLSKLSSIIHDVKMLRNRPLCYKLDRILSPMTLLPSNCQRVPIASGWGCKWCDSRFSIRPYPSCHLS